MSAGASRAVWLLLCVVLLGFTPGQDYRDSFANGVREYERGNYQEALRFFQSAVRANNEASGENIPLTGRMVRRYYPHFYLAMTHYRLGDCESAIDAWQTSLEKAAIALDEGRLAELNSAGTECVDRLRGPLDASAQQAVNEAEAARAAFLDLESEPRIVESGLWSPLREDGRVGPAESRAQTDWSEANDLLNQARRPPVEFVDLDLLAQSIAKAESGRNGYALVRSEVIRLLDERVDAVIQRAEEQYDRATTAKSRLAGLPEEWRNDASLTTTTREAEGLLQAAESSLRAARGSDRLPPAEEAEAAAGAAFAAYSSLVRAAEDHVAQFTTGTETEDVAATDAPLPSDELPAALIGAADALFNTGDYQRAASLMEGAMDWGQDALVAKGLLIRAAARFSLYRLGGESDRGLLDGARDDIASALRLDAGLRPDDHFSPSFVTFFNEVAAGS